MSLRPPRVIKRVSVSKLNKQKKVLTRMSFQKLKKKSINGFLENEILVRYAVKQTDDDWTGPSTHDEVKEATSTGLLSRRPKK